MSEVRITRYDDGGWCEQEYASGKLHLWTVFHATGEKHWQRQYANGRQEGYERTWDKSGRLLEEQWFHLGYLHGPWRKWTAKGDVEAVADFVHGYQREDFESTINQDFNEFIKPYYTLEPEQCQQRLDKILSDIRRQTLRMCKAKRKAVDLAQRASYWNHVNVLGAGEKWPAHKGASLFPILQIDCASIPLRDNPLDNFSYVTLFAANNVVSAIGEDIVVRAYAKNERISQAKPPCAPLNKPAHLEFSQPLTSYPDKNDLPPGLLAHLEDSGDKHGVLDLEGKPLSHLGGWPRWLQFGRLSGFGRFAFQVDSLDIENWACGDCTIHYFFLNGPSGPFAWCQEMA